MHDTFLITSRAENAAAVYIPLWSAGPSPLTQGSLYTQHMFLALLSPAAVCVQLLAHLPNHVASLPGAQYLQVQCLKCREYDLISPVSLTVILLWLSTV